MPKDVQALPAAISLDGRLKEFRDSLPLLLDLKNESLRDRLVTELQESQNESHLLVM